MSSAPNVGNPSGGGGSSGGAPTSDTTTPGSGAAGGGGAGGTATLHPTHVSEVAYEFLLAEILHWVDSSAVAATGMKNLPQQSTESSQGGGDKDKKGKQQPAEDPRTREELTLLAAERAAAKVERLGFGVGYRLCERLAQSRPLLGPTPTGQSGSSSKKAAAASGDNSNSANLDSPTIVISPAMQLEAVKFLCKEFWTEIFRKQIDKLQTNHRGVFVLKDHELRWLKRLPPDDETARVQAIKMLAFPCGLIRGALANLGIGAVVSCDFLADGKTMAACSFNIKVKT